MNNLPKRSLAILAALSGMVLMPVAASAHHITGSVKVDCTAKPHTVSVTVTAWSGNVEITRVNPTPKKVTERAPAHSDGTVVFTVTEIGGNGTYTAGRQGAPHDPEPVGFTVHCVDPTPTPTPHPTPTPTSTPTPSASPTGGQSPGDPTPTPSGSVQSVLGAATNVPGLPVAGTHPDDANGAFLVALALAMVSMLAIGRVLRVRR